MGISKLVSIELYADLVCPWCWIGDRRLWRALAAVQEARPSVGFDVIWRPFQLDPTLTFEGLDWNEVIETKFGGRERAAPMFERVAEAGATEGCIFSFDRITRMSNTSRAHGLVLHAQQTDRDPWPLVDAIYSAHFSQGADLGNTDVLAQLAAAAGFTKDEFAQVAENDKYDIDVQESQREAARLGIRGVPFVVLASRYGISGAQPESVFVETLTRVADEQ